MKRAKTPAFTLIELLVSLVIAALAINLSYMLINNSLLNDENFETISEAKIESEYMFRMLRADIDEAMMLPKDDRSAVSLRELEHNIKTITIKRLSWSPLTNQLEPLIVTWTFSNGSIIKSVISTSIKASREYVIEMATFHFDWIDENNVRFTIQHPNFHKSTILFFHVT